MLPGDVQVPDATLRYGEWRLETAERNSAEWKSFQALMEDESFQVHNFEIVMGIGDNNSVHYLLEDREAVSGGDERHSDSGISLFLNLKWPLV